MKKPKLHINYFYLFTAKVNSYKNELKRLQEEAEITTNKKEVDNLIQALDELKAVLESIPTVNKAYSKE